MLPIRAAVLGVKAYQPADQTVPDPARIIQVDANESPLGPPPAAIAAAQAAVARPARYPDGGAAALRRRIAEANSLDAGAIVLGNGSDELIHLCCRSLVERGDEVIVGGTGFAIYRIAAMAQGARVVVAEERDFVLDPASVEALITERTRIVFVANPNNPTGALLDPAQIAALRAAVPPRVLLVLDAAYAEYVEARDYEAGHRWVEPDGNVAVLRTFSKAYGLAGLRTGWMHGPAALVDAFNRIRPVFNINVASQAACAVAVGDEAHLDAVRDHAARSRDAWRGLIARCLEGRFGQVILGQTNFAFLSHAPGLVEHLRGRNIVAFALKGYGLPDAVRISFGTNEENAAVIAAVEDWARPAP